MSSEAIAQPQAAETQQQVDSPMAQFFATILRPGVHPFLIKALNITMVLLFMCLAVLIISEPTDIHVWVFSILALGLFGTINWFLSQLGSSIYPENITATVQKVNADFVAKKMAAQPQTSPSADKEKIAQPVEQVKEEKKEVEAVSTPILEQKQVEEPVVATQPAVIEPPVEAEATPVQEEEPTAIRKRVTKKRMAKE